MRAAEIKNPTRHITDLMAARFCSRRIRRWVLPSTGSNSLTRLAHMPAPALGAENTLSGKSSVRNASAISLASSCSSSPAASCISYTMPPRVTLTTSFQLTVAGDNVTCLSIYWLEKFKSHWLLKNCSRFHVEWANLKVVCANVPRPQRLSKLTQEMEHLNWGHICISNPTLNNAVPNTRENNI